MSANYPYFRQSVGGFGEYLRFEFQLFSSARVSVARFHVSGSISGVYRPIWIRFRGNVQGGGPRSEGHVSELPQMGLGVKIIDCEHAKCLIVIIRLSCTVSDIIKLYR